MPTADEYVNLVLKRFLSQNRMEVQFRKYLEDVIKDGLSRVFPASGVFTYPVTLTFTGPSKTFSVNPDPTEGIDNSGNVIELVGTARTDDIPYEEAISSTYWVGLKFTTIPSGLYYNPRTGIPEYDKIKNEVGEKDNPDSVTYIGSGVIRFDVDSIFESGVNHSGRKVLVWLVNPVSADASVAIEECTVAYGAPNNIIDTVGPLGQASPSTAITDYMVAALGVTVRKGVSNPFGSEYILLGKIVVNGSGVPSFNPDNQNDLSAGGGHTLQRAYEGAGGPGTGDGRTIIQQAAAIQLRQQSTAVFSHDIANAALRLRKDLDTAYVTAGFNFENAVDITSRLAAYDAILNRANIYDISENDELLCEETNCSIEASSARIIFNRVGVDLALGSCNVFSIIPDVDLAEISGATTNDNGLYIIDAVYSSNKLTLKKLDGSSPSFVTDPATITARLYRPIFEAGPKVISGAINITALTDAYREIYSSAFTNGVLKITVPELDVSSPPVPDNESLIILQQRLTTNESFRTYADGRAAARQFDADDHHGYTTGNEKIFTMHISPWDVAIHTFQAELTSGNARHDLIFGPSGTGGNHLITLTGVDKVIGLPLHFPDTVEILSMEGLAFDNSSTTQILELDYVTPDYTTPAAPTRTSLATLTFNTGVDPERKYIALGTPHTVDNISNYYNLLVYLPASGQKFYGCRIRYRMTELHGVG